MRTRLLLSALAALALVVVAPTVALAQESEEPEPEVTSEEGGEEAVEIGHAEEECIHLLEEGGEIDDCQESPSPILPATEELIWGSLAFAVLFVVMWKFALPPVRQMMKNREERIRTDLERAESAKTDADQVLEDYRAQLADARNEAARIIDEARHQAEQVAADVKARAEADAAEVRSRADADARHAADRALADVESQVGELSIELAEKIVGRNLDRDTQMQLVRSYIDEVGRN